MTTRKWLAECHAWLDGVTVQYETSLGWVNSMGNMSPITHPHYLWRIRPATIMLNGTELPKPVDSGRQFISMGTGEGVSRYFWFNTREDRDAVYAKLVEVLGS
jgi:hypothetical protein